MALFKECPFGFDNEAESSHPRVRSSAAYPSEIFPCGDGNGIEQTTQDAASRQTYKNTVADVIAQYQLDDSTVSSNFNPRAKYAGCLVRTAGHDFMDYRKGTVPGAIKGGSDGCINFADEDNTGLADCLENSGLPAIF